MDRNLDNFVPQNGMDVYGSDGEKVGEIDAVEPDRDYFIVRKGFFFPQDHYIPLTAVSSYEEDRVYLNVTKDEALEQEWANPPAGGTTTAADRTYETDMGGGDRGQVVEGAGFASQGDTTYDRDPVLADQDDRLAGMETDVDRGYADRDVNVADRDHETVQVHEEELAATRRDVNRGEVRVHKDVVEEQQNLEVPVTEEEVNVTRRRVDRDATADDHAFEEGTIEVPLRGEEVDVEKRARVVEEVDIDKTAREHTERVSDTVRREDVRIEGDDQIDIERDRNTR